MPQTVSHIDPAKRVPADVNRTARLVGGLRCFACPRDRVPVPHLWYVPLLSGGVLACSSHKRAATG